MRSSVVLSLAILAAIAPSLAVPTSQYTRRQTTSDDSTTLEQSGAFSLPYPYRVGRFPIIPILPPKQRLVATRAAADEQSGAFLRGLFKAAKSAFDIWKAVRPREVDELLTREFDETLFARELFNARSEDESGAFWGALLRAAPTIIRTVSRLINKRDVEELSAREFESLLTRELEEQFARELRARGDDEGDGESGAFSWRRLLGAAPAIAKVVSSFFKRGTDMEELFARAVVEARSLNELD